MTALDGVRVLGLGQLTAGPLATWLLSSLGAAVCKVERPDTGEGGRSIRSPGESSAGTSYFFDSKNAGKQSVAIDIKTEAGRAVLRDLVADADVLVENYVPGTLGDLGLGPDDLIDEYPSLVYCSISGYGHDGVDTDRRAYDAILQATSGLMTVTGITGDPPTKVGASVMDNLAGYVAATAVVAALERRDRTGGGGHVDVAMQDCAAWLLGARLPFENRRTAHQPAAAPWVVAGTFRAADAWVSLSVPDRDAFDRLDDVPGLDVDTGDAAAAIEAWVDGRGAVAIIEAWRDRGLPAARVASVGDVAGDDHLDARGAFTSIETPDGTRDLPRSPFGIAAPGITEAPSRGGPDLGEHTDAVLRDLGYDADAVDALRTDGVVE